MIAPSLPGGSSAAELRADFDARFAAPRETGRAPDARFVAVRIADEGFALRLSDIAGLYAGHPVLGLPSAAAGLVGVAAFRGRIAPVYDLATMFGYADGANSRWLACTAHPVAFAFGAFDGQWLVPPRDIVREFEGPLARHPFVRGAITARGEVRPIVDLRLVYDDVLRRADAARITMEK